MPTLLLFDRESVASGLAETLNPGPRDDLALKPLTEQEALLRVRALLLRAGFAVPGEVSSPDQDGAAARYSEGRIVVLFGAKGGVGKTTLAVNLALCLIRRYHMRVLLLDGDLWFGDLIVLLKLPTRRSIADLPVDFDLPALQQVLTPHASGLLTLLAPPDPIAVERLPAGVTARAAMLARTVFDVVVVDTHPSFDETNLQLLEACDLILLVTTPELSAVRNTSRFLDIAENLGFRPRVRLVLNRANSGIRQEALQRNLGCKFAATVVSAGKLVVQAANEGVPVVERDPHAENQVTRDFQRLTGVVMGRPPPEAPTRPRGLLSWARR